MKALFLGLISLFFLHTGTLFAQNEYNIIPQPKTIIQKSGLFTINANTAVVIPKGEKELLKTAGFLVEKFKTVSGFNLIISSDSTIVRNMIQFRKVSGMALEEYKLVIKPGIVTIESSYPNGAFYALQTIYQLLPAQIYSQKSLAQTKWTIPCVVIEDAPRFSYRGMLLDVCSHFFPVEDIKRYLDLMAIHKQNVFHWHLTEDQGWRIEIKKYPKLTEFGSVRKETVIGTLKSKFYDGIPYGGFYTQDEMREIIQYASDRFITVLPEIEMPGHALAAISCYPNLSCGLEEKYEVATRWGVFRQVYCPKAETFEFLEDVLTEIMDIFPSKNIHIGGDECPKVSWQKCSHCQDLIKTLGLKDEFELQSFFIQRIEKFVNAHGRQIIGWDEILQGGLAPNATVMSWLGEEGGIKAAQHHHDVVMCPHTKYYLDYYQANPETEKLSMGHLVPLREVYDYNPVPDTLTADEQKYIKGVQGCVWTEYMSNFKRVEYMAFPRACAISEAGWSPKEKKDWKGFTQRLEEHFKRLDVLGVNYCKAFYDVFIHLTDDGPYSKVATLFIDSPNTEIHYTIDGSSPNEESPVYTGPFVINKSTVIKAVGIRNSKPVGKETYKIFN